MGKSSVRHITGFLLSTIFLACITVPLVVMQVTDIQEVSHVEKRRLEKKPEFSFSIQSLKEYPRKYEQYFNDHFGLRNTFVNLYNSLFVALFETSTSFNVLVGQDKWLYFSTCFAYRDFTGNHLSSPGVIKEWKARLFERIEWLDERNIKYLLLPVPYKISIYTEHLPERIQAIEGQTNLNQLVRYLDQTPQFSNYIDFQEIFTKEKENERVYYKTDSHWNLIGGYIAYTKIIARLKEWFPDIQVVERGAFDEVHKKFNGNLTRMINIGDLYEEDEVRLEYPNFDNIVRFEKYTLPEKPDETFQDFRKGRAERSFNTQQNLKAVVITDSFGTALKDYLALSFKEIVFIRDARFEDMMHVIEREKPDVVLDINGSVRFKLALGESVALRNRSVKDLFKKNIPFFQVSGEMLKQHVKTSIGVKYDAGGLEAVNADPQLIFRLDDNASINDGPIYVHCNLTSPEDTHFQIFYRTEDDPYYSRRKMVMTKIQKGENDIYLRIHEKILMDELRVDIGGVPGKYQLRSFQIIHDN